ncbi:hypothetical protein GCM10010510_19400 [Streptomyces anandii JCM 4720]|nr:hypothetical protein GCM10010510_19400 [Streptomyces anandii JCM 4720]
MVAQFLEWAVVLGEDLGEPVEAGFDVPFRGFQESVGVEGEEAAFGEVEFLGFERQAAEAQWGACWKAGETDALGWVDDDERWVSSTGDAAPPGYRVVNCIEAGHAQRVSVSGVLS